MSMCYTFVIYVNNTLMYDQLIIFGAKYLFLVIVLIAGIFFWKQNTVERKQLTVLALFSLPLTYLAAKLGSLLFYDPRPFVVGHFSPLIPHDPDNGFPSDHTLLSSAIAWIIFWFNEKSKTLGWAALCIAFVVGASRVLAGVHSPIDIFGSIIIAGSATYLVKKALLRYGNSLCIKDFGNN